MKEISTLINILILLLSLMITEVFSQSFDSLVREWRNQHGSTLTISSIDSTGKITGTYQSPSGTTGKIYTLIGWANYQEKEMEDKNNKDFHNVLVLSFCVRWVEYGSITSWTGYYEEIEGVPTLFMLWHLVRATSQFSWGHILTDQDVFKPVSHQK